MLSLESLHWFTVSFYIDFNYTVQYSTIQYYVLYIIYSYLHVLFCVILSYVSCVFISLEKQTALHT